MHQHAAASRTAGIWPWLNRPIALAIFLFCLWSAWQYPVASELLALGLVAYVALLVATPQAWLVVLPVLIPTLELGFLSGRFFFEAFDLFVLTTIAWGLWLSRPWVRHTDRAVLLAAISLLLVQALITANGLFPLSTPVPGAWTDYFASTNALRQFKGILYGLALWPMLAGTRGVGANIGRWFAAGMIAGLVAVAATIIWERGLFTGLFNFTHAYRVSGWFFTMHTGGAAIDAYLAMVATFALAPFLLWREKLAYPVGFALIGLVLYSLYVTYSRANYPAVLAMLVILAVGFIAQHRRNPSGRADAAAKFFWAGAAAALAILVVVGVTGGKQIQQRFETSAADLQTRFDHWSTTLDLLDPFPKAFWIGRGKGSFPRDYYVSSQLGGDHLALAHLHQSPKGNFIRFSPSDMFGNLFLRQRITNTHTDVYEITLRLRAQSGKQLPLLIEFCERHVLDFRSECRWTKVKLPQGDGNWQEVSTRFKLRNLGGQPRFGPFHRPLDVSVMNRGIKQNLDIGSVQIRDKNGQTLVRNPDFSAGWDHWFYSYGNHLRWHIKNVFVYWLYEGGMIGLLFMAGWFLFVFARLMRQALHGDRFSLLVAASIAGVIMVGLFDSLFDDARIGLMIIWLAGAGLLANTQRPAAARPQR